MKTANKIIIIPDFMIIMKTLDREDAMSLTEIFHETKITYSHIHKIKKALLNKGWISVTKDSSRTNVRLTEEGIKGIAIINKLLKFMDISVTDIVNYRKLSKRKKEVVEIVKESMDEIIAVDVEEKL